jgi:hypothetical protein
MELRLIARLTWTPEAVQRWSAYGPKPASWQTMGSMLATSEREARGGVGK